MKNVKPMAIVSMMLIVLGFMMFCWAIPSILTGVFGCPEGSIFLAIFRALSIVGQVLGLVLVILLFYVTHRVLMLRRMKRSLKFHEDE